MKNRLILAVFTIFFPFSLFAFSANHNADKRSSEARTTAYFENIKFDDNKLEDFLYRMPKGGDLHNHQSGATFPENLLRYASDEPYCLDKSTFTAYIGQCAPQDSLKAAAASPDAYRQILKAWSMLNFVPGKESGHDHFFATFGKVGAITGSHTGEILAEIVKRAARQNELYLELMTTADNNQSGLLGKSLGYDNNVDPVRAFAAMRTRLLTHPTYPAVLKSVTDNLNAQEQKKDDLLACHTKQHDPGCRIKVRYLYQVLREQPPEAVFAQLLTGFEAAEKDPRVVGINMVQPEDGKISMRDYALHMEMIKFLRQRYPNVHVSLHAGELNETLVPPIGLTSHINDAVNTARTERVGHGVDIASETNYQLLLEYMAQKHILVEINLSSNEGILGVTAKTHPLPLYMQYNVPLALSTDDEGVSRDILTTQYVKAVHGFNLTYPMLKNFSRNSITYSFLPGKSLWTDYRYSQIAPECARDKIGEKHPSQSCIAFLAANEKAHMQWKLEHRFHTFEKNITH